MGNMAAGEDNLIACMRIPPAIKRKGDEKMEYQIETKGPMTVIGFERRFAYDSGFTEIPKFWEEFLSKGMAKQVAPLLGCCFDDGKQDFGYLIGDFCDADAPVPEGMTKREIPAYTWAMFHTEGTEGKDIQALNQQIFSEWLPGNLQYEIGGPVNIEVYPCDKTDWEDKRWGIWLPVQLAHKA